MSWSKIVHIYPENGFSHEPNPVTIFLRSRPLKRRQLTFGCLLPTLSSSWPLKELDFLFSILLASWKKSNTSLARLSGEPQLLKCLSKHVRISRTYLSISVSSWYVCCWSASLWCFCEELCHLQTCNMPSQLTTKHAVTGEAPFSLRTSLWRSRLRVKLIVSLCIHLLDLVNKLYND